LQLVEYGAMLLDKTLFTSLDRCWTAGNTPTGFLRSVLNLKMDDKYLPSKLA